MVLILLHAPEQVTVLSLTGITRPGSMGVISAIKHQVIKEVDIVCIKYRDNKTPQRAPQ